MTRFGRTTWFLTNLGVNEAVIGDLVEQRRSGRSRGWFWRQVLLTTGHVVKTHAVKTMGAVVLGWVVLWVFFRFVGAPLARFDDYLLASGLTERYSAAWWLRSAMMWFVVAIPFLASGWLVARVAPQTPLLPSLTFALSVSVAIFGVLVFDTGQGNNLDLLMWLTVPLFLVVAPAAAIAAGGFLAGARTHSPNEFG